MALKLDFEKLKDAVKSSRPSTAPPQNQNYGTSYKSPYSKQTKVIQKRSAPTLSVNRPPPNTKGKVEWVSPYSRNETKRNRPRIKRAKKIVEAEPEAANEGTKVKRKTSANKSMDVSGFFTTKKAPPTSKTMARTSVEKRKATKKARGRVSIMDKAQVKYDSDFGPDWNSLLAHKRLSIRDGSMELIDVDLAEFSKPVDENYDDDIFDDDDEEDEEFNLYSSIQDLPNDSLVSIRHGRHHIKEETAEEYDEHRKNFIRLFCLFFFLSCIVSSLTIIFVFRYNYGFQESNTANATLQIHEQSRVFVNSHMILMVVLMQMSSVGLLQFRLFPNVGRTKMKWIHACFEVSSVSIGVCGLVFSFMYHKYATIEDFYSLHSYVGTISCVLYVSQLTTGLVYILPFFSWDFRVSLNPIHKSIGSIILLADASSILTGCVQMVVKYFDLRRFPALYPNSYFVFSEKSVVLNLVGILALFQVCFSLYLQTNYHYRRRLRPGVDDVIKIDPDHHAISTIQIKRHSLLMAKEQFDFKNADEVQLGSRKSFNYKYFKGHHLEKREKSIPTLINSAQTQKANFTDADFLISLE